MSIDTSHSILRSARSFFAGTAVSRVSGLLRDVVMAVSFGSCPEVAAFMVAYRLANLFRRLFGEGNLQAGFVPRFIELKERGGLFFRDATFSLGLILSLGVALLMGLLWAASAWVDADWAEILHLAMWMAPGLFFICLYGLNSSVLQCQKKYFLPAVAPVVFNLLWIGAVLFRPDVRFLSMAITGAFAGQWLLTVFESARLVSLKQWLRPQLFSPEFKTLLRPLMLGIVGVGAAQFNSALDAIFARFADLEGPAYLWYAIRIQQLPMALFGIALSGALLPPLSREEDSSKRLELLRSALKYSAALMFVCTFGIFALATVGVNLLYGHGDFSPEAVQKTAACLWGYGLGLVPSVFVLLLAARFYAAKEYRIPTFASLVSVGANCAFNVLFIFGFGWGAVSIAIGTSLSAFLNMILLSKGAFTKDFALFLGKAALSCALPTAMVWMIQGVLEPLPRSFPVQFSQFAILSGIYLSGVLLVAWRLGMRELLELTQRRSNP